MAMQSLGLGTANAGDGDALRTGGEKINANFTELYTIVGNLATVATSGAYGDLTGKPTLGTAAGQDSTAFATAAQGAKADAAAAGPATSTDNAIARFDATTGKILQNSGVVIDDSNNITGAASIKTANGGAAGATNVLSTFYAGQSGNGYGRAGYNVRFTSTSNTYQYDVSDSSACIEYGKANGSYDGGMQVYTASVGTAGGTITFTAGPYVAVNGTSWTSPSDERLKENVQPLSALDRIVKFRAVTFDWKQSGKHDCGVIAQEVLEAFPEVVDTSGDFLGVDYGKLAALAMQAVKELAAKVAELEGK
ncbi:tail fiber domain-containing protein [Nitrobacteraceae bacterium UC4446_H13]